MLEATSAELAYRCSAGLRPCHILTCRRALLSAMAHLRAQMCLEPMATQPHTTQTRWCSSSRTTKAMAGSSAAGTGTSPSSHPTGLRHRPPSGHPRACRAGTGSTTGAGAAGGASADCSAGSGPCQPQAAAQRPCTFSSLYFILHCPVGAFATTHLHFCTCSCQMITH